MLLEGRSPAGARNHPEDARGVEAYHEFRAPALGDEGLEGGYPEPAAGAGSQEWGGGGAVAEAGLRPD